jgi:hypothetical protein
VVVGKTELVGAVLDGGDEVVGGDGSFGPWLPVAEGLEVGPGSVGLGDAATADGLFDVALAGIGISIVQPGSM